MKTLFLKCLKAMIIPKDASLNIFVKVKQYIAQVGGIFNNF